MKLTVAVVRVSDLYHAGNIVDAIEQLPQFRYPDGPKIAKVTVE